ncbi:type III pantothenate kinase [Desulfosarcina sp. BuS5]|uniref:type III pantothenate kinase n=1 Tax=Desulfosarcina sp. BuS5 TaxID=933262 RepID=UPI000482919B|nr:type III pantothenate kinase [Desulfosarcina sp. BuS5]WDN90192.1 type III pantothenate kinase [Desulfosarcina sp. BuS5]
MLLAIDVGNTNIVAGIFEGDKLKVKWRFRTEKDSTEDEFQTRMAVFFEKSGISFADIKEVVVSSVVPSIGITIDSFCYKCFACSPLWVDASSAPNLTVLYREPAAIGADRIVNAVAAFNKYGTDLIVIDFGTATTFDAVSGNGEYLGGAISPGIKTAAEALFLNASQLPRFELSDPPEVVIGTDTVSSMESGIIYGYACLVDGMVRLIGEEMDKTPMVIATGGLATLMLDVCEIIKTVEPDLTLEGLCLIGKGSGLHS